MRPTYNPQLPHASSCQTQISITQRHEQKTRSPLYTTTCPNNRRQKLHTIASCFAYRIAGTYICEGRQPSKKKFIQPSLESVGKRIYSSAPYSKSYLHRTCKPIPRFHLPLELLIDSGPSSSIFPHQSKCLPQLSSTPFKTPPPSPPWATTSTDQLRLPSHHAQVLHQTGLFLLPLLNRRRSRFPSITTRDV